MQKRKLYYLIIAAICFVSISSLFLPYLKLPQRELTGDGTVLDAEQAALNSNVLRRIARDHGLTKKQVTDVAKDLLKGKEYGIVVEDLTEDKYYVVDIVDKALQKKITEVNSLNCFNGETYHYFDLIRLAANVIRHLERDVADSVLVILTLIVTTILPLVSAVYMLMTKGLKHYKLVKIISVVTILLCLLGMVSANSISIGALQVERFYTKNWGIGYFLLIFTQIAVWLTATAASYHGQVAGYVTWRMVVRQKELIIMAVPFLAYAFLFNYYPLAGWAMAFQKYKPAAADQMWIAWEKFKFLFGDKIFFNVFRNTVAMSVINLVFSFAFAIGFALLLNEVRSTMGKKFVQTVSYLPHFLSWIIVAGIVQDVLSMETGILNEMMTKVNLIPTPINFFADPKYFWWIIAFAVVWKETGWNSIIYLATMTTINPDLYEAASIDGAGRWKKMVHITLPGIRSTIFVLLIINLGMIMNSGFEAQYLLGKDLNRATSYVIDVYVLNNSFGAGIDFSLGTAAGIFKSVVSILLIFVANRAAKAAGQERLF
ncbi:putative aldouronate transport system permease protein [Anaerotaenia torta]|uniref:ABC transporter permease n=1 Tax=Anaerotaenia torta TaxID=433293 RepID=UPI003D23FAFD